MSHINLCRVTLALLLCISIPAGALAQSKPRWVKKGVKELNARRTNDTYQFRIFHMENPDKGVLELDRFAPLVQYVDSVYAIPAGTPMVLDSIADPANGRTTYTLTFNGNGVDRTVYAQEIDAFTKLDDFVVNKFEYNHWQLFAIGEPSVEVPTFDNFTVTRSYDAGKATAMSIIPGLGQLYKGQTVKGAIFMATDIALFGLLGFSEIQRHHFKNKRAETGNPYYHNEITTYRELSVFSAIAGAGLWIYNIFDAAFCPIPRRVEISRPNSYNAEISFSPMVTPDFTGSFNVGLGVDFSF